MSSRKVTPDNIDEAISEILEEYSEAVVTDMKDAVEAAGKVAAETAQAFASGIGRGRYAKSIKSKVTEVGRVSTTVTVYSTQYRIAHLLEHGHTLKVHGKTVGSTRGTPHFAKAETQAESALIKKIEQAIKGA